MEFCSSCESDSVVFGKTKIKVGRETFKAEAEHCEKCGNVAIGPKLQAEIDAWASQFTKSIVELQPYFSESMIERIVHYAGKYSLHRSEFMKACTTAYLQKITTARNFRDLRSTVLGGAVSKYPGKREKICVPVKYQLFKKIELYSRVWNLEYDSNVMEEAVLFCVTVLDSKAEIEESKKQEIIHFVEDHAMAS